MFLIKLNGFIAHHCLIETTLYKGSVLDNIIRPSVTEDEHYKTLYRILKHQDGKYHYKMCLLKYIFRDASYIFCGNFIKIFAVTLGGLISEYTLPLYISGLTFRMHLQTLKNHKPFCHTQKEGKTYFVGLAQTLIYQYSRSR